MLLRCNSKPRIAVRTRSWKVSTVSFILISAFHHSEFSVCPLVYLCAVWSDTTHPCLPPLSRNPSRHGRCHAPTSELSTSWRTCSRKKRSVVWVVRPASSRPYLWLRRPATNLRAARRLSRRRKVGLPSKQAHLLNKHAVRVCVKAAENSVP